MKDVTLDRMTVKELKELKGRIELMIASRADSERVALREAFKQMAEEAGYTVSDILGGTTRAGKGRPVAAKFANPEDPSQTWSGRGRQPNWLSAKVKAGADPEDFRL